MKLLPESIVFYPNLWYIDHWSLWLDLKIIAQTVNKIVSKEGVDEDQNTTMTEFMSTLEK